MSIFGKIKDAIFGKAHAATPPAGTGSVAPPSNPAAPPQQAGPAKVSDVDVERNLAAMAEGKNLRGVVVYTDQDY